MLNKKSKPTSGGTARALRSLAGFSFFVVSSVTIAGQDQGLPAQGKPDAPSALENEILLERVRSLETQAVEAGKILDTEREALARNLSFLDERRRLLAATRPLDLSPAPASIGATEGERARAAEDHFSSKLAEAVDVLRTAEELSTTLDERLKRLAAARSAAKDLETVLIGIRPLAAEYERRRAAGETDGVGFPEGASSVRLVERLTAVGDLKAEFTWEEAHAAEMLPAAAARVQSAKSAVSTAELAKAAASRAYREAVKKESFEKDLEGKDPATLAALLTSGEVERIRLQKTWENSQAALRSAADKANGLRATVEALTPPAPDRAGVEATATRVAVAERAFKQSEEIQSFYVRREGLLRDEASALAAAGEKAEAAREAAAALEENLQRMEILVGRLTALEETGRYPPVAKPRVPTPAELSAERAELAAAETRIAEEATAAGVRLAQTTSLSAEAHAAALLEEERVKQLRAAFEAAREIARFVEEIEKLPTSEVVLRFEEAVALRREAQAKVAAEKERLDEAERAVEHAEIQLAALEDPLLRAAQQQFPDKRREILEKLKVKTGIQSPSAREGVPVRATQPAAQPVPAPWQTPASSAAAGEKAAASAAPARTPLPHDSQIEARESLLSSRVRVLDERAIARGAVVQALNAAKEAVDRLAGAAVEALQEGARAFGAATELQTRVGIGKEAESAIPAGVSEVLLLRTRLTLQEELAGARLRRSALDSRAGAFESESQVESRIRQILARALSVAGRKLDSIRRREELEKTFERDPASLTEIESKRLDQEVERRLSTDQTPVEFVLSLFQSTRAEQIQDVLKGYYKHLLGLEAKLSNIERRKVEAERMIRLAEEERKVAEDLLPVARGFLVRLKADDAEARIRFGLNQATNEPLLAMLKEAGRSPPQPRSLTAEEIPAVADRLFDSRMRVFATESWLSEIEVRLSRLGIDADVAVCRNEIGGLEARAAAVEREIKRHVGQGEEAIQKLDSVERPRTEEERTRFLAGEIGSLRLEKKRALWGAAGMAVLSLIAIPVVAFLLLRLTRGAGKRIVERVRQTGEEQGALEREQRAQTLVHVFRAALSTAVIAIAGIYLLKQFRIDVTPILASAGVVGLAIAFGAQTLIRDFLAGFFMLLENQYKIGDIIKIGETGGVVERITLRLTVLRDLHGVVHFIPNGTVQQVSNMTQGWSRAVLEVGVAYKEDVDRVMKVLRDVGEDMLRDRAIGMKLVEAPEVPGVEQFGDSAITVRMLFKTRPAEQWNVAREARRRIKRAFDAEGIEIPFPQRVVYHIYPQGRPAPATDKQTPTE